MRCRLCDQQEESELHLMMCDEILDEQLVTEVNKISLCDVWSTHSKQISAIKVLNKIVKIRNIKYEKRKLSNWTQVKPHYREFLICCVYDFGLKYIMAQGKCMQCPDELQKELDFW